MSLPLNPLASQVRLMGDPILRQRCTEVTEFGPSTERLASMLLDCLERSPSGAGLAANQAGFSKRAFAYDLRYRGEDLYGVVFNPVIEDVSKEATYEEGCLSIPDFFWPVVRPARVSVVGQDQSGRKVSFKLRGIGARLFLHENDHLDGLLIFDRIPDEAERKAAQMYANQLATGQPARVPQNRRVVEL